jgi:hypothetical protein
MFVKDVGNRNPLSDASFESANSTMATRNGNNTIQSGFDSRETP